MAADLVSYFIKAIYRNFEVYFEQFEIGMIYVLFAIVCATVFNYSSELFNSTLTGFTFSLEGYCAVSNPLSHMNILT